MGLAVRILLLALILLISFQYFQIQFYSYPEPTPFTGSQFYNPYQTTSTHWLKANFHAHAIAWGGITNGHQPGDQVQAVYGRLGYDLAYLSDYFSINSRQNIQSENFMPIYEHGINIHKSHRLAIGSEKVSFFDVMLFQNQDIRQYLIKRLKQTAPVVAINHPTMRNSHPVNMLQNLTGYDYLEVLNSFRVATSHWDTALSAGKPVYILANDDCHDVRKAHKMGKSWTMVHATDQRRTSVLEALRLGKTYGVQRLSDSLSIEQMRRMIWRAKTKNILESLTIVRDTLKVRFTHKLESARAIGQNGKLLKSDSDTDELEYSIKDEDAYIRIEAQTSELAYYFNPVFRYDGLAPPTNVLKAKVRFWPTFWLRLGIIYGNLLFIALVFKPYFITWINLIPPSLILTRNYQKSNAIS